MNQWASMVGHAITGWLVCGATVAMGRQVTSLESTLLIHAVVAPVVFGLLTWHHFKLFPQSSPAIAAGLMLLVAAGLDALVVAPYLEHSYVMFGSILGTWFPFASIYVASFVAGRAYRHRRAGPSD